MRTVHIPWPSGAPADCGHPDDELSHWTRVEQSIADSRVQAAPLHAALAEIVVTTLSSVVPWRPLVLVAVHALAAWLMWRARLRLAPLSVMLDGTAPWPIWRRTYMFSCVALACAWSLAATWSAPVVDVRFILPLAAMTAVLGLPWWALVTPVSTGLPVTLQGLDVKAERAMVNLGRTMVMDWDAYTSSAKLRGARLIGIVANPYSVTFQTYTRRGESTINFTARRINFLATAAPFPVADGAVRVDRPESDAKRIDIRYMLVDPHASPLEPPEVADGREPVIIGLFESGVPVELERVNTLIAGASRSGKSGIVNAAIRHLACDPLTAIVGIDLKPGSPELGPWREVMAAFAGRADHTRMLLTALIAELERRGRIMECNGWKTWRATARDPDICVIIDEVQRLDRACRALLIDLCAISMAYGAYVLVATQYPTDANLPSEIKANLIQRIGLRTADDVGDRVVFGGAASRTGWTPSLLCAQSRQGSFLIDNARYTKPLLARAWWVSEEHVRTDVEVLRVRRTTLPAIEAAHRTPIDDATLPEIEQAEPEVYEVAEVCLEEQILRAIDGGASAPSAIATALDVPVRTVKSALAAMKAEGLVVQDGERRPYRRP